MRRHVYGLGWRAARLGALAAVLLFAVGCEDGGDDSDESLPDAAEESADGGEETNVHFPDGLHPDAEASVVIASVFKKHIKAAPQGIGDNDPNTVVCMGDSITAGGYPGPLASMCGKNVIDEGRGGERSGSGASRAGDVLSDYKPAYLCILYGANDVIDGSSPSHIVANLESIINTARSRNTIPIVATLTPMYGSYSVFAGRARQVSEQIRAMAGRTSTPLADLEDAF